MCIDDGNTRHLTCCYCTPGKKFFTNSHVFKDPFLQLPHFRLLAIAFLHLHNIPPMVIDDLLQVVQVPVCGIGV